MVLVLGLMHARFDVRSWDFGLKSVKLPVRSGSFDLVSQLSDERIVWMKTS